MHIPLGQDVYSSDNKKVGTVSKVVMDADNKEVKQFVIGSGFFTHEDKLVDHSMVASSGNEGVVLNIPAATVHKLPNLVTTEHLEPRRPLDTVDRSLGYADALGGRTIVDATPDLGRGYEGAAGSFFDPAPLNPPIEETERNIPDIDVTLGKGTDVISSDGKKLGTVDEILFDNMGNTSGFIVESGLIEKHHFRIPIDWVGEVDDNKVHLTVTAEKVHSRSSPEGNPI